MFLQALLLITLCSVILPCLCGYDANCKTASAPHGLPRSQIKDCSNPGTPTICESIEKFIPLTLLII